MIGLIDPALLLPRPAPQVEREIDEIVRICVAARLVVEPLQEYWPKMWSVLGSQLERSLPQNARQSVQQLRRLGARSQVSLIRSDEIQGKAWRQGFGQLFSATVMGISWEEDMAAAVIRSLSSGHDVVLLTRRMLDRNLTRHAVGNSVIDENTRWVLHVQPRTIGHKRVPCVHHRRNLTVPWTTRFDWRLPDAKNGCPYPFCPPASWHKGSHSAVQTVQSKPTWRDALGNGWARPNIPHGAGYHWDVFLTQDCAETAGLQQINVVEYGSQEGTPGHIHHIPTNKAGHLTGTGWTCSD